MRSARDGYLTPPRLTAGRVGTAAGGGARGGFPPPSSTATLAAGRRSPFHHRLPEAALGFMKDMCNTNKASQQGAEPSCRRAAAVQGSLLCRGRRWVHQALLLREPQSFSSRVKSRKGRRAGGLGVTALGKGR